MTRMGCILLVIAALLLGAILLTGRTDIGQALFGRWRYTESVEVDRSRYFRLKVELAYKGEPLTFDIVVGCNARITRYKDSDRTVEVGVAPIAYGLKMKDGRGVVVRPPEACNGQTTDNGQAPARLLPLIVTYENADEPWFGLAYASDHAYDSPLSELKFFGATISAATRQDWDEWREREGPKNFVTYELIGRDPHDFWKQPQWQPGMRFMGYDCQAASRVRLPEAAREAIRPHWPAHKPTYWYPDETTLRAFRAAAGFSSNEPDRLLFEGYPFRQYSEAADPKDGMARLEPNARLWGRTVVAGSVFPARTERSLSLLGADGLYPSEIAAKPANIAFDADVRPELRGFAYCDGIRNIIDLPFPNKNRRYINRINGEPIDETLQRGSGPFGFAFERDEYVYIYRIYTLVNIFGGL